MTDNFDIELENFLKSDNVSNRMKGLAKSGHKIGRPKGKKDKAPRPREKYKWSEERKRAQLNRLSTR